MTTKSAEELRAAVRDRYGKIAREDGFGCGCACGDDVSTAATHMAGNMGYSDAEVSSAPAGANLGLGCGNPQAIASLQPGEVVLDLGSGGGFDCFLAAQQVGDSGYVIGVDMTPDMISKASDNAQRAGATNVTFRLGEIEHVPVETASVDVIMSNCVINLSPDKPQVYREAYRVLRSGGRLAVADVVITAPLPDELQDEITAYTGCVSGAVTAAEIEVMLADAGFEDITVRAQRDRRELVREWSQDSGLEDFAVSALIEARKP